MRYFYGKQRAELAADILVDKGERLKYRRTHGKNRTALLHQNNRLGCITRMDMTPLFFDAVLGFFAGVLSRSAAVRCIAWWIIPVVVTFLALGPPDLLTPAHGESSMFWLLFAYLLMLGFLASGVGTLFGYFVRRATTQKK